MKTLLTFLFAVALAMPSLAQSKKISQFQNTNTLGGGDYLLTERADGLTNNNIRWSQLKAQLTNEVLNGFQPADADLTNLAATVTVTTAGDVTIPGNQTNRAGLWFTNFPAQGATGIKVHNTSDLIVTNGRGWIVVTTNGGFGVKRVPTSAWGCEITGPMQVVAGALEVPDSAVMAGSTFWLGLLTRARLYSPDTNSFEIWSHGKVTPGDLKLRTVYATNEVVTSNVVWTSPRWLDQKFSGLGFGLGVNVPARTQIYGGVFGRAFAVNDDGDFSIQFQHGLSPTNALFPQLYYSPHIHISVASIGAGESNCTFIMEYQITPVGSNYAASLIISNTLALTATNTHYVLSLGNITNNFLQAKDSVVARGNLKRIAAPTGDLSAKIFLDSLDFHIPVNQYGSSSF